MIIRFLSGIVMPKRDRKSCDRANCADRCRPLFLTFKMGIPKALAKLSFSSRFRQFLKLFISFSYFSIMQNAEGINVDLYIPRKCSWTNRILGANDFGAVQINVATIDPVTGVYTKSFDTFAMCGFIRGHVSGGRMNSNERFDIC